MSEPREQTFDFGLDPDEDFEPGEIDEAFDLALPHVMTVLGPIDPGALGIALTNEQILDESTSDVADVLPEVEAFFAAGGRALIDARASDAGRVSDLVWLAQRSPAHLVASVSATSSDAEIATLSVSPGMLALDVDGAPNLARVAQLQRESGLPISISGAGLLFALRAATELLELGIAPERIAIRSADRVVDDGGIASILQFGVSVTIDQWQRSSDENEKRADVVMRLIERGYLDQLMLSCDLPPAQRLSNGGEQGWTFALDSLPLLLMEAGVSANEVRTMLVENPARFMTIR